MTLLKDTKFVLTFLCTLMCGGFAVGSRTAAVSKKEFGEMVERTTAVETRQTVAEKHSQDTDDAIRELRKTNQAIYETVIGIAERVGARSK